MLQKLNERIQGVVAWVVIILIAVTFTLFGIDYYMQNHQGSNSQVEVNGEPITKESFEQNYRRARQFREPSQLTAVNDVQLKKQVLDEMVMNSVSVQAAKTNGFSVNLQQANAAVLSIPQFQEDGHFSADKYQQALSGAFFTPESFQKEVRQGMLLNQQRFAFIGTAFALPNELERFVRLYMQTRDYNYLPIPVLPFIKQVNVTPDEINAFYEKHKNEFQTPEKVSIDYIFLSMQDMKKKANPTEEDVKRYYDENESNFTTPAQWQVAHILFAVPPEASEDEQKEIQNNADKTYIILQENPSRFDEQVQLSDDKLSIKKQGVLPWIVAGQSDLDKSLVNLTNPGQLSAPVKSQYGFEIFKLMAYKPSVVKPFAEVKEDIRNQVSTEIAQNKYTQSLEQLSDLSYQTPDSLAPVADTLKLKVDQSESFSRKGGNTPLTKNKQVISAAYSNDVLDLGNNSDPIQVDNDIVVVLRVNKHLPSRQKTLEEVKALINDKLALQKAELKAKNVGDQLLQTQPTSAAQEKLITDNHLQWQEVLQATRESDKAPEAVNELAFNLPRAGTNIGGSTGKGDYVIVHLSKINDGALQTLDKEQIASITQQIEASYGTMDYDLFVRSQLSKANIVNH